MTPFWAAVDPQQAAAELKDRVSGCSRAFPGAFGRKKARLNFMSSKAALSPAAGSAGALSIRALAVNQLRPCPGPAKPCRNRTATAPQRQPCIFRSWLPWPRPSEPLADVAHPHPTSRACTRHAAEPVGAARGALACRTGGGRRPGARVRQPLRAGALSCPGRTWHSAAGQPCQFNPFCQSRRTSQCGPPRQRRQRR